MAYDELASQFRKFGLVHSEGSPLYRAITLAVASAPEVLELVAGIPPAQRVPNLLLAAVHDLLLAGVDHPLAAHYPSLSTARTARGDPASLFIDFCASHRESLRPVLMSRATQTNEVGRASALLPAVGRLTSEGITHIALVDLGSSAGLNLFFDRYRVRYVDEAGASAGDAGELGAAAHVQCVLRGSARPPFPIRTPSVIDRIGMDQNPIDITSPEDVRWLLACVWPDQLERFVRLRAAIDIARLTPPRVLRGTLPSDARTAIDAAPDGAHLVVLTTWVLAYLSAEDRARVDAIVAATSRGRDLTWVLAEQPHNLPFVARDVHPDNTVLAAVEFRGGARPDVVLGEMHGHGTFLQWAIA